MEDRATHVDPEHIGLKVCMPLVGVHDGEEECLGSAFLVAPGLAITACHVLDHLKSYHVRKFGYQPTDARLSVFATQVHQGTAYPWWVDRVYNSTLTDIAFIRFFRPAWWGSEAGKVQPPVARLRISPPNVGDNVTLFGFVAGQVKGRILRVSPYESKGHVTRVHLPSPELEFKNVSISHVVVRAHLVSGMSGGPCFDSDGNVIGVNHKGWGVDHDEAKVALLWAAMGTEIDLFQTGAFPAHELFTDGPLRAVGYQQIHVSSSEGVVRLSKVDPETLRARPSPGLSPHLGGAMNSALGNARDALASILLMWSEAVDGHKPLREAFYDCIRAFFLELCAAVDTSVTLACRRSEIEPGVNGSWSEFTLKNRARTSDKLALERLSSLEFRWNGVDLFELRTYALWARSGFLPVNVAISVADEGVKFGVVDGCRVGGHQVALPAGLYRFYREAIAFIKELSGWIDD